MTEEEAVKQKWPDAYLAGSYSLAGPRRDTFDVIVRSTGKTIGFGSTRKKAWADAAKRMQDPGA